MEHKATGIICGLVKRKYIGEKFATLTIKAELEHGSPMFECFVFDEVVKGEVARLDSSFEVRVAYNLSCTKLADKSRRPIIIDGYEKWIPRIVISEILEAKPIAAAPAPPEQPDGDHEKDDDIPF